MAEETKNPKRDVNIITLGSKLDRDATFVSGVRLENPINSSSEVFDVINNYRGTLKYANAVLSGPAGKEEGETEKMIYHTVASPSLFNPYYSMPSAGATANVPLMDTQQDGDSASALVDLGHDKNAPNESMATISIDAINDCSIENLVSLSKIPNGPLGQARYKYTDFMYCRDLGKISNNYMITLRKFATPILDNIFYGTTYDDQSNLSTTADVGRMITWFNTPENKIEDILKYTYFAEWKEFTGHFSDQESQENAPERGLIGNLVNLFNPAYNKSTVKGVSPNALSFLLSTSSSDTFYTSAPYANNDVVRGARYDNNMVYEPKDTVRSTHKYEGTLHFNHEFTLTFNYKLRGYDNINAKSAFLDLLANILTVTYRQGTFWGGEQRILGSPQNLAGWQKAQEFAGGAIESGASFLGAVLKGGNVGDAANIFAQAVSDQLNSSFGINISEVLNNPSAALEKLTNTIKTSGIGAAFKGSIMNQLGRPAVYAFDSILTNDAVGLWHVTIGNPLNPIAVMGNLILTNCELSHSGPMGLDDFPTDIKVVVTLKHATPRDAVDIQKMYTQGRNAIYSKISNAKNFSFGDTKLMQASDKDTVKLETTAYAETIKSMLQNVQPKSTFEEIAVKDIKTITNTSLTENADYTGWIGDYHIARIRSNKENLK